MFGPQLIPNEFFRAESNSFLFHSNSAIFGHFLVKNGQKWGIMLTNLKQIRFHFVCGIGTGAQEDRGIFPFPDLKVGAIGGCPKKYYRPLELRQDSFSYDDCRILNVVEIVFRPTFGTAPHKSQPIFSGVLTPSEKRST